MDTHYVIKMNKLTLLDLVMPNMSDFELYQKIRMLDDKVKICFLTASGINHEEFRKRAASIATTENCFFIKPIENEDLIKRVNEQLL
jgi:response regulator RpfG family c-di-GMP phosphodiesterase